MRILLIPRIEEVDGTGSLTIVPMQFIQMVTDEHQDAYFMVVVGKRFADRKWLSRYLSDEAAARVELVPCVKSAAGARKFGYHAGAGVSEYLRKNAIAVDVVLSNCFPSNPVIRSLLEWKIKSSPVCRVPMVSWSLWTGTNMIHRMGETAYNNKFDVITEFFGAVCGDAIIYESELSQKGHLEMFREYFRPGIVRDLMGRSLLANLGVVMEKVSREREPLDDRRPVVLWSGFYHVDGIPSIEAMESAYKLGLFDKGIVNHMCCNLPDEVVNRLESYGWDVFSRIPHLEYLQKISEADIFVSVNWAGAYGSRYAEMLGSGAVGVIHEDIRFNMLPEGYPYVCDKKTVGRVLIKAIRDHASNSELVGSIVKHMKDHHDTRANFLRIYDFLSNVVDEHIAAARLGWLQKAASSALVDVDEVGHDEACRLISEASTSQMDLIDNPMIRAGVIRWSVLAAGFDDVGGKSPHYLRRHND